MILLALGMIKNKIKIKYRVVSEETITDLFGKNEQSIKTTIITGIDGFKRIVKTRDYKEKFELLKNKREYKVFLLTVDAIGETIPRALAFKRIYNKDDNVVVLPYPENERVCNIFLLEYLSRIINLPLGEDLLFWKWVVTKNDSILDYSNINLLKYRQNLDIKVVERYSEQLKFSENENVCGYSSLNKLGLSERKFVCLHARTNTYNENTLGGEFSFYDYRNSDFRNYEKTANFLNSIGLMPVKIGRDSDQVCINGVVDYAGTSSSDFMDLFIAAKSKFFVVGTAGIWSLASMMSIPLLVVNRVPIALGFGGALNTYDDMFIPKKYYDRINKRYLSLREMANLDFECLIYGDEYENRGIIFEENSEDEILEAVIEMNMRLDGKWEDTDDDVVNMRKFESIFSDIRKESVSGNNKNWMGEPMKIRLCATYMRRYPYLLD